MMNLLISECEDIGFGVDRFLAMRRMVDFESRRDVFSWLLIGTHLTTCTGEVETYLGVGGRVGVLEKFLDHLPAIS